MFKNLEHSIQKIPREGLTRWKRFVELSRVGHLLDNIRAVKLKTTLGQISVRTTKSVFTKLIGQGNAIAGKIRQLESRLKQIPRAALQNWRNYLQKCRDGNMLDRMRAQMLQNSLGKIPLRTLKDA